MSTQENPNKADTLPPSITHQGKKKKQPTECSHKKRQYHTCGLCGSEDIATQGVNSCNICDEEVEILTTDFLFMFRLEIQCGHNRSTLHIVKKCLTCGATEGPLCPSCGKPAWRNIRQQIHCSRCRYMRL